MKKSITLRLSLRRPKQNSKVKSKNWLVNKDAFLLINKYDIDYSMNTK